MTNETTPTSETMPDPKSKGWNVNDLIQIDPAYDERFGGCILQVTETKSFGVKGFVQIPAGGQAPYRLPWDGGEYVGLSAFVPRRETDDA